MGTVKPWQVVVMVVCLLGAGVMAYVSMRGGAGETPDQASDATMVDIRTGELFVARYPDKRPVSFPAPHPDTQQASLYPAMLKDDKWVVKGRFMADVRKDKSLKADLIIDQKTGEFKPTNPSPRRADQIFAK